MPDTGSDRLAIGLLWLALACCDSASAYETDQFTHRLTPISDSSDVLDRKVNQAIAEVVKDWRWGHDEVKFCFEVYQRVGGRHWVDRLERWAMTSPEVEKIAISRRESIYWGHPFRATRVAFIFGIGSTIKINGVHVGSDKIGHFFSQGFKYYRRYRMSRSEAEAAHHSAYTERAIFGQMTTGSYSNADLVANYEGHRFYRSLFENAINGDLAAIVRWNGTGWTIQRPFRWADHVNAYWDEALNINHYDAVLHPFMAERLVEYCDDYRLQPERFVIKDEDRLRARYAHLELRETGDLRLERLCSSQIATPSEPASDGARVR